MSAMHGETVRRKIQCVHTPSSCQTGSSPAKIAALLNLTVRPGARKVFRIAICDFLLTGASPKLLAGPPPAAG
eukprot:COSAG01_NODE_50865_length_359_cov_1.661538_1_plen_72_part_01